LEAALELLHARVEVLDAARGLGVLDDEDAASEDGDDGRGDRGVAEGAHLAPPFAPIVTGASSGTVGVSDRVVMPESEPFLRRRTSSPTRALALSWSPVPTA